MIFNRKHKVALDYTVSQFEENQTNISTVRVPPRADRPATRAQRVSVGQLINVDVMK